MPSKKRSVNYRINGAADELIKQLGLRLGLSGAAVVEFAVRLALRTPGLRPTPEWRRWHDNAGITSPWTRRVSDLAYVGIKELAERWGLSESDTLEFLVWDMAKREELIGRTSVTS